MAREHEAAKAKKKNNVIIEHEMSEEERQLRE
jgi:hypothetical protein